ncbi:GRIP domain protein [Dictyocaulus viviparus]|uniref:GRIP domain protein n=1 Tax=Dictyocaulus viviparus TaxID=29172 RepID=A0A0D8X8Q6_DICVI|nr:GRIP domain protein [Dictyocaulus viviparus]
MDRLENGEYLKNIIMKFIKPESIAEERKKIVPIISEMLRLSPDESDLLNRAAIQYGS